MGLNNKEWLISFFSGLTFSKNCTINFIRITVFIILILFFLIPTLIDITALSSAGFAFMVAVIILAIKLVLITMNLIVNHTQTIPNESQNRQNNENNNNQLIIDMNSETPPENIPQELWDLRYRIPRDSPVTENVFSELIAQGFNPNDVVRLVELVVIVPSSNQYSQLNNEEEEMKDNDKNVLTVFGHQFLVPFNRLTVDSVFTGNYSYLYAVVSFFFNFAMTYTASLILGKIQFIPRFYLSCIYGAALYSSLSPPEVDGYSTTRGDVYTGISRTFALLILNIVLLSTYWTWEIEPPVFFDELQLPFSWNVLLSSVGIICYIFLYGFPLFSILLFGHPITSFTWIFEWVSQYALGQSGATGILHAFLLLIRGAALCYIVYSIIEYSNTGLYLGFSCIISIVFLQFPITKELKWRQNVVKGIITTSVMSLIGFYACYQASQNIIKCGDDLILLAIAYMLIFDIVFPYISSYSSYIICFMRINLRHSKTLTTLRLLTPCLMIPIVIGINLTKYKLSPILTTMIIVSYINKGFTEPHIATLALFLQIIFFQFELDIENGSLGMLYALIIARKLVSVFTITQYFIRARLPYFLLTFDSFIGKNTAKTDLAELAITFALDLVPGPDRSITTISFFWSFFTGAPFNTLASAPFLIFPMPPRPNHFWNQVFVVSQIDIARSYLLHRTEHPIETPVYTSMSQSLVGSLAYLVTTGKLGFVSSNSFFLFLSEPFAAFVHIIAIEANVVYFQLRGLEYNDETFCHLGEIARLKDDIDSYRDFIPNFRSAAKYKATDWRLCAKDIKIFQYNVSKFASETLFLGLDKDRAVFWTFLSLAYSLIQINGRYVIDAYIVEGEMNEYFEQALSYFDINLQSSDERQAFKFLEDEYINLLFDEESCLDLDKFQNTFQGCQNILYQEACRRLLLWFSLLSMDIGPETDEKEDVLEFIRATEQQYFIGPIQSGEFNEEFEKGEKDLVTFENIGDGKNNVLFFRKLLVDWDVMSIQKEFVRSFWASETMAQIYFGEDNSERMSIQEDDRNMRNLIVQACDLPIGYPAYVSPILTSYNSPSNYLHLS